jgi:cell division protein ZipA
MPELRWTLLVLGALFIAALAWWELRRQRQAPRQDGSKGVSQSSSHSLSHTLSHTLSKGVGSGAHPGSNRDVERGAPSADGGGEVRGHREPTISFPELQPEARSDTRSPVRGREPTHDPPVVELDDDSFAGLRVEGETDEPITTAGPERIGELPPEPPRYLGIEEEEPVTAKFDVGASSEDSGSVGYARHEDAYDEPAHEKQTHGRHAHEEHAHEERAEEGRQDTQRASEAMPAGASAAGEPIVEWPSEGTRKIVALRLVSAPAARFPGRAVRLALAAEGFVLGKFDIFHKPGPDSRAMLSVASLTKPGTFAMNTIDGQRFGGLSLFAVLPGPLPAQQTFDELLASARSLNERLQGALQDERGEPLTPMRSASIREGLANGHGGTGDDGAQGAGGGFGTGGRSTDSGGRVTQGGTSGGHRAESPP